MTGLKIIIPFAVFSCLVMVGCDELHQTSQPLPPHLWTADVGTRKLYCYNLDGTLEGSIPSPCNTPAGICFDGKSLWIADANIATIWRVDWADGRIVDSIPAPGNVSGGMAYDGYFLWIADVTHNRICQLNPITGKIVYEMTSPGSDPEGLAYDGTFVWVSCDNNRLSVVYPQGPAGIILGQGTLPFNRCTGLGYAHNTLWALDGDHKIIYRFNPTDLGLRSTFTLPEEVYPNALDFADPVYGPGYE